MRREKTGRGGRLVLGAVLAVLAFGCAPRQSVPLDVAPDGVVLYLDGEPVAGAPLELRLRSDRDHKLYFKRDGYQPEMVVLRSIGSEEPRLEPERVRVALRPVRARGAKDVAIELED